VPSGAESLPANLQTPYFDAYIRNPKMAKAALAKSGGDPAKFMDLTDAYFQKLASKPKGAKYGKAWAARDANNRAIATGGAPTAAAEPAAASAPASADAPAGFHVLVPGKKATVRMMTADEATAKGLPTNQVYQINDATGQVTPVSGTDAGET
jgi:hypothetical protein